MNIHTNSLKFITRTIFVNLPLGNKLCRNDNLELSGTPLYVFRHLLLYKGKIKCIFNEMESHS